MNQQFFALPYKFLDPPLGKRLTNRLYYYSCTFVAEYLELLPDYYMIPSPNLPDIEKEGW